MNEQTNRTRQIEEEQRSINAMHARLEAAVDAKTTAHERALATPVDASSERYARDLKASGLAEDIRRLLAASHSLCFGRIDSSADGESLPIGRIGLRTEAGDLLLIDWRAEAARPFYSATLASPLGVRRRRHLRLDGPRVVDVSDEILDGTPPTADDLVGNSPLVAALGAARTGRMHEAAATLQSEQDAIVRSPHRGVMIVDGGPGTGKTIVALHRAAYMLYAFPAIADRGVLVFGPNQRFLTYISDVLPSLGENDVRMATTPDLLGTQPMRTEPEHIARVKGRSALADSLSRWVKHRQPHGVPLELRTADDTVILAPAVVDAARRHALQGEVGHNHARELFTEYIVDDLVNELEHRTTKEISDFEEELEGLLGIDLDRITGHASTGGSADAEQAAADLDIDWDSIRDGFLDDPGIDQAITRVWPRLDAGDVVRGLLDDREALRATLPDVSEEDVARLSASSRSGWSTADLSLLDEARALVDGPPEATYGHIVVDEAQQLSEMQWRMVMRRCPNRSMTIVGDLAQAGPGTTIRTWEQALGPFVGDRFAQHTLTVNYRTTSEIVQATEPLLAQIAPDQRLSRSIRHGEEPRVIAVSRADIDFTLLDLIAQTTQKHPAELIGVVATAERSAVLEAQLSDSTVTIVAAPDARGLEFDTVFIVDPAGIQAANGSGRQDLYVAQTRATKRLLSVELVNDVSEPADAHRSPEVGPEGLEPPTSAV